MSFEAISRILLDNSGGYTSFVPKLGSTAGYRNSSKPCSKVLAYQETFGAKPTPFELEGATGTMWPFVLRPVELYEPGEMPLLPTRETSEAYTATDIRRPL